MASKPCLRKPGQTYPKNPNPVKFFGTMQIITPSNKVRSAPLPTKDIPKKRRRSGDESSLFGGGETTKNMSLDIDSILGKSIYDSSSSDEMPALVDKVDGKKKSKKEKQKKPKAQKSKSRKSEKAEKNESPSAKPSSTKKSFASKFKLGKSKPKPDKVAALKKDFKHSSFDSLPKNTNNDVASDGLSLQKSNSISEVPPPRHDPTPESPSISFEVVCQMKQLKTSQPDPLISTKILLQKDSPNLACSRMESNDWVPYTSIGIIRGFVAPATVEELSLPKEELPDSRWVSLECSVVSNDLSKSESNTVQAALEEELWFLFVFSEKSDLDLFVSNVETLLELQSPGGSQKFRPKRLTQLRQVSAKSMKKLILGEHKRNASTEQQDPFPGVRFHSTANSETKKDGSSSPFPGIPLHGESSSSDDKEPFPGIPLKNSLDALSNEKGLIQSENLDVVQNRGEDVNVSISGLGKSNLNSNNPDAASESPSPPPKIIE